MTSCAGVGLGFLALLSDAQTLSPGEVRVSSRPYEPQSQVLQSESQLVRIDAVVRDAEGRIVPGLRADDFAVFDNGKKQTISTFAVKTHTPLAPVHGEATRSVPPAPGQTPDTGGAPPAANNITLPRSRYVALYFDDLHTTSSDIEHVQVAAQNFLRSGLTAGDQVALFTASSSLTLDFTPDPSVVLAALATLKSHARVFDAGTCPRITAHDAYLIANNHDTETYRIATAAASQCNCESQANFATDCYERQEQVVLVQARQTWEPMRQLSQNTLETIRGVVNYLAKKPGERVLVLASSGFLTGTLETDVDEVVDDALHSGIVVNALDAKGLYNEDPSHGRMLNELHGGAAAITAQHEAESFSSDLMSLTAAMADFAVGTGGQFFHDRNDLTAGYYSLAAAPETDYLLGFAPGKEKLNGALHKLKVEISLPGKFDVQARPGYFAPTKDARTEPTPEEKIDAEVRASQDRSDFPLRVTERTETAANGHLELSVQAHVEIQKLSFEQREDRHANMLTFVVALFDAQGKMIAGKEAQMELALKPQSFDRFSKNGINGALSLEALPGAYRLRVVVEEAIHGEMSATSQNMQIQ
jgi:VWFA-related protein